MTQQQPENLYLLLLNDMRGLKVEVLTPVCWAFTVESLIALVEAEKVEPYWDGAWQKVFRAGGPLEWRNMPGPTQRPVQYCHPSELPPGVPCIESYLRGAAGVPDRDAKPETEGP